MNGQKGVELDGSQKCVHFWMDCPVGEVFFLIDRPLFDRRPSSEPQKITHLKLKDRPFTSGPSTFPFGTVDFPLTRF